MSEMIAGNVLK